ncbi:MAG: MurR/RpiR family transcriptional regulator [Lachnospiraceae bacterium]|jgi:RpiR family carbohydrate utilization transcriptional regulator|nr:MurR/RpiR family transcriptional regulator [Lachnospiraceae bacterium]
MSQAFEKPASPDDFEYVTRIRTQYASLSKKQKKIADFILANPDSASYSSITLLAKKLGTSTATISRFCQALSYKSFSEMKLYLGKKLVSSQVEKDLVKNSDPLPIVLQKLAHSACQAIDDTSRIIDSAAISKVADSFINANTIHFYGQSGGYITGLYAKQLLLRAGILSQAINDNVDMQLAASTLKSGDVAVGIAYSGEIRLVIDALKTASANGATTVVLTATPGSSMAKLADYSLIYSPNIPDDLCYLHLSNICEINILGSIQTEILRRPSQNKYINNCKEVILRSRKRTK